MYETKHIHFFFHIRSISIAKIIAFCEFFKWRVLLYNTASSSVLGLQNGLRLFFTDSKYQFSFHLPTFRYSVNTVSYIKSTIILSLIFVVNKMAVIIFIVTGITAN